MNARAESEEAPTDIGVAIAAKGEEDDEDKTDLSSDEERAASVAAGLVPSAGAGGEVPGDHSVETKVVEEVKLAMEVKVTDQSPETPSRNSRRVRGGDGGERAATCAAVAAELEAELRAIMGTNESLAELLEKYADADDGDESGEDDDEDWEPEARRVCVNCMCPFPAADTNCPRCKEHFESGILARGHRSRRKFPRSVSAPGGLGHAEGVDQTPSGPPYNGVIANTLGSRVEANVRAGATAVGYDERMLRHEEFPLKPIPHPERPNRLRAIMAGLAAEGLFPGRCVAMPCREAVALELNRVHTESHLEEVEASALLERTIFTPDTYANEHSALAARLAAGTSAEMAIAVYEGRIKNGVALVRPPGHHAESEMAMGFCLHNNAAVAARAAQAAGAARVMILDWDVHHGNGTQAVFLTDPSVLYVSLHRHEGGNFYPGTGAASEVGAGPGAGFTANIPWPTGGIGDGDYVAAFCHVVLPLAYQFQPDLTIVSAGFDAAKGDPLGGCNVTPAGYANLTALLAPAARGRLLVVLEGGYNLRSISASTSAVTKVLLGDAPPPLAAPAPTPAGQFAIAEAIAHLAPYWTGLSAPTLLPWGATPVRVTHPASPLREGGAFVKEVYARAAAAAEGGPGPSSSADSVLGVVRVEEITVTTVDARVGGGGGGGGGAGAAGAAAEAVAAADGSERRVIVEEALEPEGAREADAGPRAAPSGAAAEGHEGVNGEPSRKRRRHRAPHMRVEGPVWWNWGHKRALYPHWQQASSGFRAPPLPMVPRGSESCVFM